MPEPTDLLSQVIGQIGAVATAVATAVAIRWSAHRWRNDDDDDDQGDID